MTDADCRCAQTEKECLGIVPIFACEEFHEYIYGAKIAAETDHKPLLGIINSLQRVMLRIRRYDMVLQYTPAKSLILGDGKPLKTKSDTEQEVSVRVNLVKKTMPVRDDTWRTIAEETDKDETLHHIKQL